MTPEDNEKLKVRIFLKNLELLLEKIKKWWFFFMGNLIIISIAGLFILSFVFSEKKSLTLDVMNSWVSLILGIVATLLSVISMFMSFYNLERTNEINEQNIHEMKQLQSNVLETVRGLNNTLQRISDLEKSIKDEKGFGNTARVVDETADRISTEWEEK